MPTLTEFLTGRHDEGSPAKDQPATNEHDGDRGHVVPRADLARVVFVALAVAAEAFHVYEPFSSFSLIGIVATLIGGYPIFRHGLKSIMERRMTMELSMTIVLAVALLIREPFTALVITLFVLVAEILEQLTVRRGRRAIRDQMDLLPETVEVFRAGKMVELPLADIRPGDFALVRPGGRIPADGEVTGGSSFVDQAAITGEPFPVEKTPGTLVYAGTINQSGVMEIHVTGVGTSTAFGRIIEAVERAEQSRAPVQRIADQLAGHIVYFALVAALLTFLFTHNIRSTISVIIVAGARGIAAGPPLALLGAIGRSAKAGAIVKGGLYVEQLAKIDTMVLDRTGTLTFGTPAVISVVPAEGQPLLELLRAAAVAELNSEHPLGKVILDYVSSRISILPAPDEFRSEAGRGITAMAWGSVIRVGSSDYLATNGIAVPRNSFPRGITEVLVARDRQYLGAILLDDQLRGEAAQAIQELKSMNIQTVLLTGDLSATAARIGRELHLDDAVGQLLPEQKLRHIRALQNVRRKVAMVGDGINDAPALAQADVGIAMGSGTEIAQESATVILIGNNLLKVAETLRIARRCHRIIVQNFCGTLAVDSVGIVLAAFGFLTPLGAAFVHVASELAFILNSARMLPPEETDVHIVRKS